MQLHIWKKRLCYFVVWTECDLLTVIVERDDSFKQQMEVLEDYVFTVFYPYLLTEARRERVQQFNAAREERRLKKLRKTCDREAPKGIQTFVPMTSSSKRNKK